jgi:hypothetical protein
MLQGECGRHHERHIRRLRGSRADPPLGHCHTSSTTVHNVVRIVRLEQVTDVSCMAVINLSLVCPPEPSFGVRTYSTPPIHWAYVPTKSTSEASVR